MSAKRGKPTAHELDDDDDTSEKAAEKREQLDEYITEYIKYMNIDPETINKQEALEGYFKAYAKKNVCTKLRENLTEDDVKAGVDPRKQRNIICLDQEYPSVDSHGRNIALPRYKAIAYMSNGTVKKDTPEYEDPILYARTTILTMLQARSKNAKLSKMPSASLWFFLDMLPQAKGAIYAATPSVFTFDPEITREQTALNATLEHWVVADAKTTMRAGTKYRNQFLGKPVEGDNSTIITLYQSGVRVIQIGENWFIPLAGTYRMHVGAIHNYREKEKKKTVKAGQADDDNEDEEKETTVNVNKRSRTTPSTKTAKSGASLSSMTKLPAHKSLLSLPSLPPKKSELPKPLAPGVLEITKTTVKADGLPKTTVTRGPTKKPPVPSKRTSASSTVAVDDDSFAQIDSFFGPRESELFSRDFHEQLHGTLMQDLEGIFLSYKERIKDDRLKMDFRFPGDNQKCFQVIDEKCPLYKDRKAAGLPEDTRLPMHLFSTFGFLNQDNDEEAKNAVRCALTIFPVARTKWGIEATTPLNIRTAPNTKENMGLMKCVHAAVNESLFHYEHTLKKVLEPLIQGVRESDGKLRSRISEVEDENSSLKDHIQELEESIESNENKTVDVQATVDSLELRINDYQKQLNDYKQQLREKSKELQTVRLSLTEAEAALEEAQKKPADLEDASDWV
jgi:hypothetical protein